MKYKNFTSQDFALDEKFQKWVLNSDEELNDFWNQFILQYPEKQEEIAQAIELVYLSGVSSDQQENEDYLAIWETLRANAVNSQKKQSNFKYYLPVAAALAGLMVIAAFLFFNKINTDQQIQYTTSYGEIEEVNLPDGSKVTLNSNSKITYIFNNWISSKDRLVFLEGEAFFDITRTDDHKKFIVKTPEDVQIQVLGTKFNINTRREHTLVFLQSGKVQVNSNKQEVVLEPGELASYHKNDEKMDVKKSSGEQSLAWKNNLFIFDDTPLYAIAREVEDFFGIDLFIANDSLANQKITAKVPRDHPEILFNVLSETLQVKIYKKGDSFFLEQN